MIIGVCGTFASGQDTTGLILAKKFDLFFVSTSDIVRQFAQAERGSIERPILKEVATELRQNYGASILVDRAIDTYKLSGNKNGAVITGIRTLGEAKAIKNAGGKIIFTDAPVEIRYQRMVDRARDNEVNISINEFIDRELQEASTGATDADFNRNSIAEIADHNISNDKTLEDLKNLINNIKI